MRFYYTLAVWRIKSFFSVGLRVYILIYLAVYGPEIIGGFVVEEKCQKTKAVCGPRRTNYGGLRNVRSPLIDPLAWVQRCLSLFKTGP